MSLPGFPPVGSGCPMPLRATSCVVCGRMAVQLHHVIYAQHIPREHRKDDRNLIPLCLRCHADHHSRQHPISLNLLPDSVYEFAVETLGSGPAYEYLRRRYAGHDEHLDELLKLAELPTSEQAWRVRYEPDTPLSDIFENDRRERPDEPSRAA